MSCVRSWRARRSTPDRRSTLRAILADADELVRNFILLLVEKGRAQELDEIAREFDALMAVAEGIIDVELTTAVELEDEAKKLLGQIEQVSGRRPARRAKSTRSSSAASCCAPARTGPTRASAAAWNDYEEN